MSSTAVLMARGLSSQGSPLPKPDISGRRSQTMTTLGASSAKRSRTTNSSLPFAVDNRADAAQSMASMSSPGRYGREPATSVPEPRLRLFIVPNESPITRRRGTSGNVSRAPGTSASRSDPRGLTPALEQGILFGAGTGRQLEAAGPELLDRLRPAAGSGARHEAR